MKNAMARAARQTMTATKWMRENWRPLAAFIYLAINVFDFLIAPIFMGLNTETTAQFVAGIMGLDPSVQAIMASKPNGGWTPLTLQGSGMFHISFGAILGVSAWSRGTEKVHELRAEAYDNAMVNRNSGLDSYAPPVSVAPTANVPASVDSPEGD
jgi:hypothetical protein